MAVLPILRRPRRQLLRFAVISPLPLWYCRLIPCVSFIPAIHHIQIVGNFENKSESGSSPSDDPADGDIELVREAKKDIPEPRDYLYSERDVILYNLSIGATEQELHWTFENHEEFAALPTFGVIPQFMASADVSLDFLPNFNPVCSLTLGSRIQRLRIYID